MPSPADPPDHSVQALSYPPEASRAVRNYLFARHNEQLNPPNQDVLLVELAAKAEALCACLSRLGSQTGARIDWHLEQVNIGGFLDRLEHDLCLLESSARKSLDDLRSHEEMIREATKKLPEKEKKLAKKELEDERKLDNLFMIFIRECHEDFELETNEDRWGNPAGFLVYVKALLPLIEKEIKKDTTLERKIRSALLKERPPAKETNPLLNLQPPSKKTT